MGYRQEITSIVEAIRNWPEEDRVALAQMILRDLRQGALEPAPRHTLERAVGIRGGSAPPPDDATVEQWIEEYRMKKYGGGC